MSTRAKLDGDKVADALPIHVKYRPESLKEVYGHKGIITSLSAMLAKENVPHSYLFTGPSGVGKTTMARIMAREFDCGIANILEIDAASNSGIDDMRNVTSVLQYSGFGKSPNRAIIIDECQGLSKQAFDSLLKSVEEPPQHVFFFFCSTVPAKIPKAIVSRCQTFDLKPLSQDDILDLLEYVGDQEEFEHRTGVFQAVARACEGSPRLALTMLDKVHDIKDMEMVHELLATSGENIEVIDLCRAMLQGTLRWQGVQTMLKALVDTPAESIRIIVTNYLSACLVSAKSEKETVRILGMLEAFATPFNATDKMAPLQIAFGRILFP